MSDPIHNIELEQALLGCLLVNNDKFHEISAITQPDHFFDPVHADIYRKIAGRIAKEHLASPVTLKADMETHSGLTELGGPAYLARLAGAAISVFAVKDYARNLLEIFNRRRLAEVTGAGLLALGNGANYSDVKSGFELFMSEVPDDENRESSISLLAAFTGAIGQMAAGYKEGLPQGILTGLMALDDLMAGIHNPDFIVIGGRPSMGKAQPLSSRILTSKGWLPMGDIRPGMKLASDDGQKSVVTGVFPQGQMDVFKVTFVDGRVVRCSEDHLWTIGSCKFSGERVVTTKIIRKMLKKERFNRRIYVPKFSGELPFEITSHPIDPWLLGVLIGDGCLTKCVNFSNPEAEILFRIQSIVGPGLVKHGTGCDFRISTPRGKANPILDALDTLGLKGKRSEEKFIPSAYKWASREARVSLLQGLMDTDGWVERFGAVRYASSSKQLALDIQELVWSLGGVCSISLKKTRCLDSYVLNIRVDNPSSIMTLSKKKKRASRERAVRNTIISVEPDGTEECQCISVSHPSQLYVTDGFVLTHNTALATSIALRVARQNIPVGIVSLEMDDTGLAHRILSEISGVPYFTYRKSHKMSEQDFRATIKAAKEADTLPIDIVPPHVREPGAIYSALKRIDRKYAKQGGLGLVVVDYLQLVRSRGNGRTEQMTEVSQQLKHMAKMLNCPVIALSQLSRGVESRDNKRPMLSDLRESGQIEQDADAVLFCYRDFYYLDREQRPKKVEDQADWEAAKTASKGIMEINVAKQRMGPIGTATIGCDMPTNRFWDLEKTKQTEIGMEF